MTYSTCDIADGMLLNGYNDGGAIPYLTQQSASSSGTISGHAYTVEFAPKDDPRPAVSSHYIDSVPEDAVSILATSKECHLQFAPFTTVRESLYGGLMSTRAQILGAKGAVVLGLVRDVEEHEALNFPVFSYGVAPCAANQTMKVVAVNSPSEIADGRGNLVRTIIPGDIVYADKSGVVIVPRRDHSDITEKAELRAKANAKTTDDVVKDRLPLGPSQKKWRSEYL